MDKNINFERCKNMIWDISSLLTSVMYSKNTTYSVVRLIFLKYVTDNCFKADTGEKMMNYVRVQKMFAARDIEGGQNAVYENEYAVADKMFIDAPLNIKKIIEDKNLSSSYLAVEKTTNMLKENGVAVVVVPGSILFGMTKMQIEQRKKLLDNKWLKAVIALPSCFYSSGVGANLLIISKTKVENVLFINASNNGTVMFTEKERKINVLTEEGSYLLNG